MDVRVGCCGFPRSRATYFARFRLVEIQQTFYQLPRLETALRWRAEAPPGFEFCLKAWQCITHPAGSPTYRRLRQALAPEARQQVGFFRPTAEVEAAWQRTREVAEALQASVIVFQCPPRFHPTPEHVANLRRFFERVDRGPFRLAWEPRGPWPLDLVGSLCRDLQLTHVVDPFLSPPIAQEMAYFRLHGAGRYRYRYTPEDLATLARRCGEFERTYVLFNNLSMWLDASAFLREYASGEMG
ncbi:MAG: DUF72 domain-containing protein [Anaerolineae bacterium]